MRSVGTMSPELARWAVALHEVARLHRLRQERGELAARAAAAADIALARWLLDHFRARWLELEWLASDVGTPATAEVLERARSRFPPPDELGAEDVPGWVYRRLNEGFEAGALDVKRRREPARA